MQKKIYHPQSPSAFHTRPQSGGQSAAVINNRVEALKALSNSVLCELESLRIIDHDEQADKIDLAYEVERFQADLIRTALLRTGGRQRAAARLLNIKATTLHAKIKRYGLNTNDLGTEG